MCLFPQQPHGTLRSAGIWRIRIGFGVTFIGRHEPSTWPGCRARIVLLTAEKHSLRWVTSLEMLTSRFHWSRRCSLRGCGLHSTTGIETFQAPQPVLKKLWSSTMQAWRVEKNPRFSLATRLGIYSWVRKQWCVC